MMPMPVEQQQECWWKGLLAELSPSFVIPEDAATLLQLHRKANRQFFLDKMDQRTFFLISCLAWMDSCQWLDGMETAALFITEEDSLDEDAPSNSIVTWMLPSLPKPIFSTTADSDSKLEWLNFWLRYFDTCNEVPERRPKKRRKQNALGYASSRSTNMEGKYKLPSAYLMISFLYRQVAFHASAEEIQLSWETVHVRVHKSLAKYFKTFTYDDIQAALCLFGLDCIHSRKSIQGLTPIMLLETYLSRMGCVHHYIWSRHGIAYWACFADTINSIFIPSLI